MIQKPKGTIDMFGNVGKRMEYIESYITSFMSLYNYEYIKVPTFEVSELYKRGVGEASDIVNKETYDFVDKGNRNMTLRPEFTAGVVRSFLENKLYTNETTISKYYYKGSCFRYERPQSGRLREFTQFGVEVFGGKTPIIDAEVINIAYKFLTNLGLKNLTVKINTLGDVESRNKYNNILKDYFMKNKSMLCKTCLERLESNPLRILDCKVDKDSEVLKNAPKTIDYLNEESKEFFLELQNILTECEITFVIDTNLVRGLDYYTHTVFEVVSDNETLGMANTLVGGGRYDNLVESLGGPSVAGVGFALGIERIITILEENDIKTSIDNTDIYVMNLLDNNKDAFLLVTELRDSGFKTEMDYMKKNMKAQWKIVDKLNPVYVISLGEEEIKDGYVTVRDNLTKETTKVKRNELVDYLNMSF